MKSPILLVCLLGAAGAAMAQDLPSASVPPPKDIPFPGQIRLDVDATDIVRHILRVHQTIPVAGGTDLILLYPRWLPGNHSPSGRIDELSGLQIHAGGQRVDWVRDPVDVYAFHVRTPAGANSLS